MLDMMMRLLQHEKERVRDPREDAARPVPDREKRNDDAEAPPSDALVFRVDVGDYR